MATPAASAFHRRRHLLGVPNHRISSIQETVPLSHSSTTMPSMLHSVQQRQMVPPRDQMRSPENTSSILRSQPLPSASSSFKQQSPLHVLLQTLVTRFSQPILSVPVLKSALLSIFSIIISHVLTLSISSNYSTTLSSLFFRIILLLPLYLVLPLPSALPAITSAPIPKPIPPLLFALHPILLLSILRAPPLQFLFSPLISSIFAAILFQHLSQQRIPTNPFPTTLFQRFFSHLPRIARISVISSWGVAPFSFILSILTDMSSYEAIWFTYTSTITIMVVILTWALSSAPKPALPPIPRGMIGSDVIHYAFDAAMSSSNPTRSEDVAPLLSTLRTLVRTEPSLSNFLPFQDSSGDMWRLVSAYLAVPLANVRDALREVRVHSRARTVLRANSRPSITPVVDDVDAECAVAATEIIAVIYTASVKQDLYGIVTRGLPNILGLLVSVYELLDSEAAEPMVADAVAICIYRLVGEFRDHLFGYLEDKEVTWDRSGNRVLQAFLEYKVP